jgi:L-threonylcarbamoyladenylate synthase
VPPAAWALAEAFWPGPLTLVLRRHPSVPGAVTGGQATVALRVPDHPVALALLRAFGDGVAAPSANRFGRVSPTRART